MSDLVDRLRAENETLREELRQLREEQGLVATLVEIDRCRERLGVTPGQAHLLLALIKAPMLSVRQCLAAMPARGWGIEDDRDEKQVAVVVSKLRNALPTGCGIRNVWGGGYCLAASAKARLVLLLGDGVEVEA